MNERIRRLRFEAEVIASLDHPNIVPLYEVGEHCGRPFGGTLQRVLERQPTPLRSYNHRVDRGLEAICLRCLEGEPGRRYDSAAALARDLERWMAGKPSRPGTLVTGSDSGGGTTGNESPLPSGRPWWDRC
jgi:hypothetical protein